MFKLEDFNLEINFTYVGISMLLLYFAFKFTYLYVLYQFLTYGPSNFWWFCLDLNMQNKQYNSDNIDKRKYASKFYRTFNRYYCQNCKPNCTYKNRNLQQNREIKCVLEQGID